MATKKLKAHLGAQSKNREKMKFEFQWTVEAAASLPVKEGTKVTVQWRRGSAKKAGATSAAVVDGLHSAKWGESFSVKTTIMSDPLTNNFDHKPLVFSLKDERKKRTIARLTLDLGDHVHRTASQSVSFPLVLSSSYSRIEGAAPPTLTLVWYSNLLQVGNRKTQRLQVAPPSAVSHLRKGLVENKRSSRIFGGQEFVLSDEPDANSEASETSADQLSDEDDEGTDFAPDESVAEDEDSEKERDVDVDDQPSADGQEEDRGGSDAAAEEKSDNEKDNSETKAGDDSSDEEATAASEKEESEGKEKNSEKSADDEAVSEQSEEKETKSEAEDEEKKEGKETSEEVKDTEEEEDAVPQIHISVTGDDEIATEEEATEEEGEGEKLRDSGKKKKERRSRTMESDEARKKRKEKKERRKTADEEADEEKEKDRPKSSKESSSSRHKSKSHKSRGKRTDSEVEEDGGKRGLALSSIGAEVAAQAKEVEEMKKHKSKNKNIMRSVVEEAAAKAGKRSPSRQASATKGSRTELEAPRSKHKHRKSMDETALLTESGEVLMEGTAAKETSSGSRVIPGLDLSSKEAKAKLKSVLTGSGKRVPNTDRDAAAVETTASSSATATAQAAVGSILGSLNRVGRALPGPISTDAHRKEAGQVMLSMANEVQELKARIEALEAEKEQQDVALQGKEKTQALLQQQVVEMAQQIVVFQQAEQRRAMEERLRIAAQQEVAERANTRRTRSTDLAILLDPVAASKRRGYLYCLRMVMLILFLMLVRELF